MSSLAALGECTINPEATQVADEVIRLQERLTQTTFSRERVFQRLETGFNGDPDHKCMGRSAPDRLARLISQADAAGLDIPTIRGIQTQTVK